MSACASSSASIVSTSAEEGHGQGKGKARWEARFPFFPIARNPSTGEMRRSHPVTDGQGEADEGFGARGRTKSSLSVASLSLGLTAFHPSPLHSHPHSPVGAASTSTSTSASHLTPPLAQHSHPHPSESDYFGLPASLGASNENPDPPVQGVNGQLLLPRSSSAVDLLRSIQASSVPHIHVEAAREILEDDSDPGSPASPISPASPATDERTQLSEGLTSLEGSVGTATTEATDATDVTEATTVESQSVGSESPSPAKEAVERVERGTGASVGTTTTALAGKSKAPSRELSGPPPLPLPPHLLAFAQSRPDGPSRVHSSDYLLDPSFSTSSSSSSPSSGNTPGQRSGSGTRISQQPKMDPHLAAAESRSTFSAKSVCSRCGKKGVNFPECAKCGGRYCTRECRLGGGKRHVCPTKGVSEQKGEEGVRFVKRETGSVAEPDGLPRSAGGGHPGTAASLQDGTAEVKHTEDESGLVMRSRSTRPSVATPSRQDTSGTGAKEPFETTKHPAVIGVQ